MQASRIVSVALPRRAARRVSDTQKSPALAEPPPEARGIFPFHGLIVAAHSAGDAEVRCVTDAAHDAVVAASAPDTTHQGRKHGKGRAPGRSEVPDDGLRAVRGKNHAPSAAVQAHLHLRIVRDLLAEG